MEELPGPSSGLEGPGRTTPAKRPLAVRTEGGRWASPGPNIWACLREENEAPFVGQPPGAGQKSMSDQLGGLTARHRRPTAFPAQVPGQPGSCPARVRWPRSCLFRCLTLDYKMCQTSVPLKLPHKSPFSAVYPHQILYYFNNFLHIRKCEQ